MQLSCEFFKEEHGVNEVLVLRVRISLFLKKNEVWKGVEIELGKISFPEPLLISAVFDIVVGRVEILKPPDVAFCGPVDFTHRLFNISRAYVDQDSRGEHKVECVIREGKRKGAPLDKSCLGQALAGDTKGALIYLKPREILVPHFFEKKKLVPDVRADLED